EWRRQAETPCCAGRRSSRGCATSGADATAQDSTKEENCSLRVPKLHSFTMQTVSTTFHPMIAYTAVEDAVVRVASLPDMRYHINLIQLISSKLL
ncbi:unnamed protein product, partial [Prorocentrum cordatum]